MLIHHFTSARDSDHANFPAQNEFVFLNFYADWCRFSNMLAPEWDKMADKAIEKFGQNGRVLVGKVDCDKESKSLIKNQFSGHWLNID